MISREISSPHPHPPPPNPRPTKIEIFNSWIYRGKDRYGTLWSSMLLLIAWHHKVARWDVYRHSKGYIKIWGSISHYLHRCIQCTLILALHYSGVMMSAIASQITSLMIVYSTVYSSADQRTHQNSASLAFVLGIHRWPVNSPHKGPVTRKMFPFDDVIMQQGRHRTREQHFATVLIANHIIMLASYMRWYLTHGQNTTVFQNKTFQLYFLRKFAISIEM